jgi:hypothetical protein
MEHSETPSHMTPLDAVADAVMVSYTQPLKAVNYSFYEHQKGKDDINEFFEKTTRLKCYFASIDSTYFLFTKYKDNFDDGFILQSKDFEEDSHLQKKDMIDHTYGVVHGKDGYWYAFSPANHDQNEKKKAYAFEVIREKQLTPILQRIQERDGGSWPTEDEIEMLMKGGKYQPPSADKNKHIINIFEIKRHYASYEAHMISPTPNI